MESIASLQIVSHLISIFARLGTYHPQIVLIIMFDSNQRKFVV